MILLQFFLNPSFRPCLYDAQVVPLLSMRKLFFLLGFCAALPLTAQVKSERIALDLVFSAPTEQNEPLTCSGNHAFPDNAFPSWSIVLSGEQALSTPSVSLSSFDTLRLPQGSTLAQPFDLHAQQVQFLPFTLRGRRYADRRACPFYRQSKQSFGSKRIGTEAPIPQRPHPARHLNHLGNQLGPKPRRLV